MGFKILDEVVARISGKSHADFLQEEIFQPLGMNEASARIGYGSAHDLALFGMFHLKAHLPSQKAILSDASLETMQNATVDTGDGRYGIGGWWITENFFGYRGVLGQGRTNEARAWLELIPSEGIVVVALSNTGDGSLPSMIIQETLSALLPSFRERRARVAADKPSHRPTVTLPVASLVGEWRGSVKTYQGSVPLTFSIQKEGEVHVQLGSQIKTLLDKARFRNNGLSGRLSGDLGLAEDLGAPPNPLEFELVLRGETLYGAVTAYSRDGGQLCYWVELKRQAGATSVER